MTLRPESAKKRVGDNRQKDLPFSLLDEREKGEVGACEETRRSERLLVLRAGTEGARRKLKLCSFACPSVDLSAKARGQTKMALQSESRARLT